MNYLATIKQMASNKERRTQNLILLLVLLVILLVSANYIFKDEKNVDTSSNSTSDIENIDSSKSLNSNLESKISNILSQISGISEVSVLITYDQDSKKTPVYNTKEIQKTDEKTLEKSVAYNEAGSSKEAIIETVETPKINGVIIVAKGANNVELRSRIASAVSSLTSVPVYKVQVFEKQG